MSYDYIARHFPEYRKDKDKVKKFLSQDSENFSPAALQRMIDVCDKWNDYPVFESGLETHSSKLKSLLAEKPMVKIQETVPSRAVRDPPELSEAIEEPKLSNSAVSAIQGVEPNLEPSLEQSLEQKIKSSSIFEPSSVEIRKFFRSTGIIGEEKNQELLIYGTLGRINLGIESLSGSGKSALLYAFLQSLPEEKYAIVDQGTAKSFYLDPKKQVADIWVIPELQKIFTSEVEEIIKNLTEGVSATHTRTNSSRDGVDHLEIKTKNVVYSFAITNKRCKSRDEEFYRRFTLLHTNISKQQTKEIALSFAEQDFEDSPEDYDSLPFKEHLARCLDAKTQVRNPFLEYLVSVMPEEITSPLRFRSAIKYFQAAVKGKTLFSSTNYDQENAFSSLDDNLQIIKLYGDTLFENIHSIDVVDRAVIDLSREALTHESLGQSFREKYGDFPIVEKSIEKLLSLGFLYKVNSEINDSGQDHSEPKSLEPNSSEQKSQEQNNICLIAKPYPAIEIDTAEALAVADCLMKEKYPQHRDQWYEKQSLSQQYDKQKGDE